MAYVPVSPLRLARQARRKTLDDLARATGVSASYLSRIERGYVHLPMPLAVRLAQVLGVRKAQLTGAAGQDAPGGAR